MNLDISKRATLQELVDTLLSDKPDQAKVKSLMRQSGIDYTNDPIDQLARVLSFIDQEVSLKRNSKPISNETN